MFIWLSLKTTFFKPLDWRLLANERIPKIEILRIPFSSEGLGNGLRGGVGNNILGTTFPSSHLSTTLYARCLIYDMKILPVCLNLNKEIRRKNKAQICFQLLPLFKSTNLPNNDSDLVYALCYILVPIYNIKILNHIFAIY